MFDRGSFTGRCKFDDRKDPLFDRFKVGHSSADCFQGAVSDTEVSTAVQEMGVPAGITP